MNRTSDDEAQDIVVQNCLKPALKTSSASIAAVKDFQLAAKVNLVLAEKGYDLEVSADNGHVTMVLNKYVLRLDQFEQKVKQVAGQVPGVSNIKVTVGPRFHQPNIYLRFEEEIPPKILLVDDEKDFVHTLSERLLTRDIDSAIAYDGEEALTIVENDAPEVMVLDLKMPGIDGIEVLRQTKMKHPDTEVIILTGHGTEKEEAITRELGAFAYLRKPVDIDVLTKTMKEAYKKVNDKKTTRKG
jgi:CheY-like chemotaxis protein